MPSFKKIVAILFYGAFLFSTNALSENFSAVDLIGESSLLFPESGAKFGSAPSRLIEANAVVSALGMIQGQPSAGDHSGMADLSNAQIIVRKNTGFFQFYMQSGYYSTPSLGTTYQRAEQQTFDSFGLVPLASISIAPNKNWAFGIGKLTSIGGYEDTFTFQNINIDRGLLWNQTSNVSRGVDIRYHDEDISSAISWNDGFYSGQMTWLSGGMTYKANVKNEISFSAAGNFSSSSVNTFATPILQNNSQIFNAIFTHKGDQFSITPYLQYTQIPANPSIGILNSSNTKGVALLLNSRLSSLALIKLDPNMKIYLPLRVEYISSEGGAAAGTGNPLYGPGSSAWSATITPTFQHGNVFARVEFSYVKIANLSSGYGFGPQGVNENQYRAMLEVGGLF